MSTQTRAKESDTRNTATQPMPAAPASARGTVEMQPGAYATAPRGTETKPAVKSTEFYIYLLAVLGVLIASLVTGRNAAGQDTFRADEAWWFISLLTIGYLVSRGLSKAGSAWRQSEERSR